MLRVRYRVQTWPYTQSETSRVSCSTRSCDDIEDLCAYATEVTHSGLGPRHKEKVFFEEVIAKCVVPRKSKLHPCNLLWQEEGRQVQKKIVRLGHGR